MAHWLKDSEKDPLFMPRPFLPADYRLLASYYTEGNRQLKHINLKSTLPELGNWGENPVPWMPTIHSSVHHRINSNIKQNISVGFFEGNRKSVQNSTVRFWKQKHFTTSKHPGINTSLKRKETEYVYWMWEQSIFFASTNHQCQGKELLKVWQEATRSYFNQI